MALIQRKIGTTSENLRVFINDATVSTGAGLANIVASSVTFAWSRDDMSTVSSGTCTTGTLGTYTVSSFVQALSTNALGWYEFDPPDGVFLSGRKAFIHLSGAPSMAPLPILIELTATDNQTSMSSQTISTTLNSLGVVMTDKSGYGVSSVNTGVNVTSFAINVGVSSVNTGVNVTSVVGSPAVTSAAGILAYTFDLGRTANPNSTVTFSSLSLSTQSVTVGGVNVTSVGGSAIVTSSPGIITVSTQTIDKAGYSLVAGYDPAKTASQAGDAMTLTTGERASLANVFLTTTQPEVFRTQNAPGSIMQIQYEILANLTEASNSGTTRTLNSVTSHVAQAITYGYDSSTSPASITRTA